MDKYIEVKPGGRRFPYDAAYHKANPHLRVTDFAGNDWKDPEVKGDKFDEMSWQKVRALVVKAGGKYLTREKGIEFLRAQ